MSPETAQALLRALFYPAAVQIFGAALFAGWIVPAGPGQGRAMRPAAAPGRWHHVGVATAAVALVAVLLWLPAEAAIAGDGWRSAFDAGVFGPLILATGIGRAWALRAGLALLLLGAVLARVGPRWRALPAALLLASPALAGHAVMPGGGMAGALHRANDALHLLAAGTWAGSLAPLALWLRRAPGGAETRRAVARFSTLGHVAVALVLASGVVNSLFILGPAPWRAAGPYLALLTLKVVLVLAMLSLALHNRYRLVPRIARGTTTARAVLLRATWAEVALAAAVLLIVAVLGTLMPG